MDFYLYLRNYIYGECFVYLEVNIEGSWVKVTREGFQYFKGFRLFLVFVIFNFLVYLYLLVFFLLGIVCLLFLKDFFAFLLF